MYVYLLHISLHRKGVGGGGRQLMVRVGAVNVSLRCSGPAPQRR